MKRPILLFLAILVVAIGLRAYAVRSLPFEQDEIYTIHESTLLFDTKIGPGIQVRPLFFFMMNPIVKAFPHTPIVLRALPFLFGIAGIIATWALARRLLGDSGALVATALVTVSAWHIGMSSFSRYYSLIYLLSALVYLFLPVAYDKDRPRDYLIALGALLAGAFVHPSFVFPVAAASLVAMALRPDGSFQWRWPTRNGWTYLWGPFLVTSIAAFALIRVIVGRGNVDNGAWRGLAATLRLIPAIVEGLGPVVCVAAAAGVVAHIFWRRPAGDSSTGGGVRRFAFMAAAGFAATGVALFVLSFVTAIYADYAAAALPLVFVSAAALVQWLEQGVPARRSATALVMTGILLAGVLPSTVSFMADGNRFDYRPAFERIDNEEPGIAVMTWPVALQRTYAPSLRAFELPVTKAGLDALITREGDAWAVISVKRHGIVDDDRGEIAAWLGSHCQLRASYQRPRLDYRMYRVDLWRCR